MINDLKLKEALHLVALNVEERNCFNHSTRCEKLNKAAIKLFGSREPIFKRIDPQGPVVNLTKLSIFRVKRLMVSRGLDLTSISWQGILKWITENWDKILRVLLSLLSLLIL